MNVAPPEPRRASPTLRLSTPAAPRKEAAVPSRETPAPRLQSAPLLSRLTRPIPVAALLLTILALVGWSLQTRSRWAPTPSPAVPDEPNPSPAGQPSLNAEELNRIQKQAETARARLVRDRDEFHHRLNAVEESARQHGWRTRLSMLPAIPSPQGFKELVVYPVSAYVELGDDHRTNRYAAVVDWIAEVALSPPSAEVTGLSLRGDRAGISTARIEVQFFGKNPGEEAPPN